MWYALSRVVGCFLLGCGYCFSCVVVCVCGVVGLVWFFGVGCKCACWLVGGLVRCFGCGGVVAVVWVGMCCFGGFGACSVMHE